MKYIKNIELNNHEKDLMQALNGTAKSALSLIPGLGQAIAGYDAYKKSNFDRNVSKIIEDLQNKVENISIFFSDDWFKTEEGQQFLRKVFDSALDTQLEDKQEFFINSLVNGVKDKQSPHLEKLKFVDMLRHLSLASLMVLAELHKMSIDNVRGPNRNANPISAFPQVNSSQIAINLSSIFHPYLVTSAINEIESQGLFSQTGEWKKNSYNGSYIEGGGFETALCYTDFTARFVEFITINESSNKNK